MITRRRLLASMAAAAAATGPLARATASWEVSRLGLCLLDPGWEALPRPVAFADLLAEFGNMTTVPVDTDTRVRSIEDPRLIDEPLLALAGERSFPEPTDGAVDLLRRHLYAGGFLFVDDTSGLEDSPFLADVRRLLDRAFPEAPLRVLPYEHAIFRSFFLLDGAAGRFAVRPFLEGVDLGDVTPVVVSRNDASGAWTRAPGGGYARTVVPGGEPQRLRAFEMGINLLMYALTANYKRDAVHVDALLQRMRDEGRIP